MSPEDFRTAWNREEETLVKFSEANLQGVNIPEASRAFLLQAGLPESAAPFLSFDGPASGPLPSAAEQYGLASEFARYRIIGANGSGDPVCLDESAGGEVVYLNHDNGFIRVLMNSSVPQLAESLLVYRSLIDQTQNRAGQDAFLDGDIPADFLDRAEADLERIDPRPMAAGGFWQDELSGLRAEQAERSRSPAEQTTRSGGWLNAIRRILHV